MLSENDVKEELSYAYVHAVAAKASSPVSLTKMMESIARGAEIRNVAD